jgi:DNA-binding FrmR family transcriptional regulator
MKKRHLHKTHPAIVKRLKRAAGHLQNVIGMIEHKRKCVDVAQQLYAVEKAIENAKETLIFDHIDHCLEHTSKDGSYPRRAPLNEFRKITKYL